MQEIQEALDERQNYIDSLLAHDQVPTPLVEPFAFESQLESDTHPMNLSFKSTDESLYPPNQSDTNKSNETVPLLAAPNDKDQSQSDPNRRQRPNWTSAEELMNIKREPITPVIHISFLTLFTNLML